MLPRFKRMGFTVEWCQTIAACRTALSTTEFGAAVLDEHVPDGLGSALAAELTIPVVLCTNAKDPPGLPNVIVKAQTPELLKWLQALMPSES